MWYILKVSYQSSKGSGITLRGFSELQQAQNIFDRLELSYQLDTPIRVKGDTMIKVTKVRLFESFKMSCNEAFESIETGGATLMKEASAIELDF